MMIIPKKPTASYAPLQTTRLYEQVVAQIEKQILDGKLCCGDRLPTERELAQQFRVSRTVIREAVKALREKGLVQSHPGRGTFVTDGTARAARQSLELMLGVSASGDATALMEVREILEPEIAARAAERATPEQIEAIRCVVTGMERALRDADAFVEGDLQFHLALAHATHNPLIPALLNPIVDLLREQRKRTFRRGGAAHGQYHHKKILAAIERRDAEAARAAMRAHLQQVRRDSGVRSKQ
ncbi:MAG: FadR family transcriptional regulator [Anaerolineae bacterium]|nr:FadR family transcriptional regulator [Anaerolineae bacterium]